MRSHDRMLGLDWVKDVTDWPEVAAEIRGARQKVWVCAPDGSIWLRKVPRSSRPFEPAIEVAMLRLAEAAGIPAAEAFTAEWSHAGQQLQGIIVRSFLTGSEAMSIGAELMKRQDDDFDPNRHEAHTLSRVREALEWLEHEHPGHAFIVPFVAVILFDAWIGNGDRHSSNWGVIFAGERPRFSPMYDPAACLGSELLDNHRLLKSPTEEALGRYAANCNSGFGDGHSLLKLEKVVMALWRTWPEFRTVAAPTVARFRELQDNFIRPLLESVPVALLPLGRKEFGIRLLGVRLAWLVDRIEKWSKLRVEDVPTV